MPLGIQSFLIAAITAAVIAGLAIFALGNSWRTLVRRLFLVLVNLNPWTVGRWRNEFSKRETFLAAWFLVFMVVLVALSFLPNKK